MSILAQMPLEVSLIPGTYAREIWPDIEEYMEDAVAMSDGRYAVEDVLALIEDFGYQLWVVFDGRGIIGAVVTGFVQYPRKKCLDLMFLGGDDGFAWKTAMLSTLKRWAADNDCVALEGIGRPAWERVFKEDGAKRRWVAFEIPVTKEA